MSSSDVTRAELGYSLGLDYPAAAARIAELEAERDRLKAALKPFADEADKYEPDEDDDGMEAWASGFTVGDLRAARAALAPAEGEKT